MSKKIGSVHFASQRIDLEEFNGDFLISSTETSKDFRGNAVNHPKKLLLRLSNEEASLLADAINTNLGKTKPLEPKERAVAVAEAQTEEKAPTT